ncbi:ABC transporter permease [Streptomyces uncialis]|uniref:ABC transporter permease n=1 Tax=Streptomyces uncialis TaxID=1048205 RepID=UPI003868DD0B|nr:ABC transporter permease [Streptomyces uncialis]
MNAATGVTAGHGAGEFAGTGTLLRLALRRDRVLLPVWVLAVGGMVLSIPGPVRDLYDTATERAEFAASITTNSSLRAMYGPAFSDSVGGLTVMRVGVFAALFAAVMSLLVVIRHTRDEEESGRQELLSAARVGRRAPLTAALLAAAVANTAIALLITAGLSGEGAAGALALGLGVGGTGMFFAATAAIAAQLTGSGRLAKGLTAGALGTAFVLRAAGDSGTADGSSALTWLSPLGWTENLRAFADERWWVPALFAAAVLVQGYVAYRLAARRDLGMSFLPTRPGPAVGSLSTAGALAWRLQRGSLYGWGGAFLAAGIVFGGITTGAADLVGNNESTQEILQRMGGASGITDAFLGTMATVFGMVAALFVVSSALRPHGEETSGRAEPVLAGAVGRVRWAGGHLVIAFGGAVALMLLSGAGLALGYGRDPAAVLGAALVQVPAVWVLGGIVVLLTGVSPRAAPLAWGVAVAVLLVGWLGPAVDLPSWVLELSPFGWLPRLPGEGMRWGAVLLQLALAAGLVTGGLAGLRRRDLGTG